MPEKDAALPNAARNTPATTTSRASRRARLALQAGRALPSCDSREELRKQSHQTESKDRRNRFMRRPRWTRPPCRNGRWPVFIPAGLRSFGEARTRCQRDENDKTSTAGYRENCARAGLVSASLQQCVAWTPVQL